ncbi:hypothetical protein FA15DRAFT_760386 [Coprinopsis marcescibilis]|uniref:Uncharacterized protein n=1 Tax=Coprinopsis marcescibilis TaxID=230819 RepID=A0A5C3KGH9_COPMA|nr:hypothetical protein FA15DRAFT_760386 [Coprinopsis marcescibilis]
MGVFDSNTGFLGAVADGSVKAIAPGLYWKPSPLISQASKLTSTLINAIPGKGPFFTHAVPAIEAIFSGSEDKVTEGERVGEVATFPCVEEVKNLLSSTLQAVTAAGNDLETTLRLFFNEAEAQKRLDVFQNYRNKIIPALYFLESNIEALNTFVPYGVNEKIKSYITKDHDSGNTDLLKRHYELKSVVSELQAYLTEGKEDVTQELFDLYLLAVVWLLTYDKIVMTLRTYLAQHFFAANITSGYIKAIATWNEDYDDTVRHVTNFADLLLGKQSDRSHEGLIGLITKRRLSLIGEVQKEAVEDIYGEEKVYVFRNYFVDGSKPYSLGYAQPQHSELLQEIRSRPGTNDCEALDQGQSIRSAYYGVQASFLEASLRPALEIATTLRNSVRVWQSRLPLSPPADLYNAPTVIDDADATTGLKRIGITPEEQKGSGYKVGETLSYAVSYVTSFGEGFLSGWSTPKEIIRDDTFVLIGLKPVTFPESGYEMYRKAERPVGKISEAQIILRVYVRKSLDDEYRIFHVADVPAAEGEVTLWDVAQKAHPKHN